MNLKKNVRNCPLYQSATLNIIPRFLLLYYIYATKVANLQRNSTVTESTSTLLDLIL